MHKHHRYTNYFCWQWLTVTNQLTWEMLQYLTMEQHLKRQSTTRVKLGSGSQMGPNFSWSHATIQETGRGPTRHVKVRACAVLNTLSLLVVWIYLHLCPYAQLHVSLSIQCTSFHHCQCITKEVVIWIDFEPLSREHHCSFSLTLPVNMLGLLLRGLCNSTINELVKAIRVFIYHSCTLNESWCVCRR